MVEEEGNTKNEVELKAQKLDMQPNASIIQPIMQPYVLNEEMKVEVQEDKIGTSIFILCIFVSMLFILYYTYLTYLYRQLVNQKR